MIKAILLYSLVGIWFGYLFWTDREIGDLIIIMFMGVSSSREWKSRYGQTL